MSPSVIKKKKKSVNRVSLISNVSKLHKHNFNLRQTIFFFILFFVSAAAAAAAFFMQRHLLYSLSVWVIFLLSLSEYN